MALGPPIYAKDASHV